MSSTTQLFDADLVPVEHAAEVLGIEPKRLRGFIARNDLHDPIGNMEDVYGWSCRTLYETMQADRENASG